MSTLSNLFGDNLSAELLEEIVRCFDIDIDTHIDIYNVGSSHLGTQKENELPEQKEKGEWIKTLNLFSALTQVKRFSTVVAFLEEKDRIRTFPP